MATVDVAVPRSIATSRALKGSRVDGIGMAFYAALALCLLVSLIFIVVLVYTVLVDGLPVFEERGFVISEFPNELSSAVSETFDFLTDPEGVAGWIALLLVFVGLPALLIMGAIRGRWKLVISVIIAIVLLFLLAALLGTSDFLSSNLSRLPDRAGIAQAILGTVMMAAIAAVFALPLGIATAVYLEEYAPDNRFTRFVQINIRNLAGVPSVVYGLLGLAIFVQLLGTDIDQIPLVGGFLEDIFGEGGITGGRTVITGGLTMAALILPIVVITSVESIRAVPQSLREGGYGVGATRWEVIKTLVLPNAFAGILTGTILSVSRAIGETAPLILAGAFVGTFFSTGNANIFEKFTSTYTVLPMTVFQWTTEPSDEFKTSLAAAAIIALLAVTMLANLTAILLRNRYEKRW
jgi:phosphate ABC transporter permease subunit PstA